MKSAGALSLPYFCRGWTNPGADLPDETRGGGKLEVLLKSALCFSSFLRWRRNFRRQWIPGQYLLSLRRLSNHVTYLTHFIHFACSKCSNWFAGCTKDHLRCFGLSGTSIGSQAVCALGSQTQPMSCCCNGAGSSQNFVTMTRLLYTVYLEVIPCSKLLTYQSITCCTHPPCLLSDAEISGWRSQISIFDLAPGWNPLPRGA